MGGDKRLAQRVPARLSRAEARSFGLVVGTAFALLAGLWWWRGHQLPTYVAAALAAGLLALAAVAPTQLRPIHRAWMAFGLRLSRVTTPLFMGLVFFLAILPIGLLRRALGHNAIVHPERNQGFWAERDSARRRSNLNRQF